MGAVFALFAAWYYWSPKIFGLSYNELVGQIHFWILFVGVNVTFLPLHFLGLQGKRFFYLFKIFLFITILLYLLIVIFQEKISDNIIYYLNLISLPIS